MTMSSARAVYILAGVALLLTPPTTARTIQDSDAAGELRREKRQTLQYPTGSTYVQWGRTNCTSSSVELVYSGFAAGGLKDDSGSPYNRLCLPTSPQYSSKFVAGQAANGAQVYGVEYAYDAAADNAFFGGGLKDQDVPCAVCYVTRTTTIMMPGRTECPNNKWTKEYAGLVSGQKQGSQAASELICVDRNPEKIVGGASAVGGGGLNLGSISCRALPCSNDQYRSPMKITCVVCSRDI